MQRNGIGLIHKSIRYNLWKALKKLSSRDTFDTTSQLKNRPEPKHYKQIGMHRYNTAFDDGNSIVISATQFIFAMIPKIVFLFTLPVP